MTEQQELLAPALRLKRRVAGPAGAAMSPSNGLASRSLPRLYSNRSGCERIPWTRRKVFHACGQDASRSCRVD